MVRITCLLFLIYWWRLANPEVLGYSSWLSLQILLDCPYSLTFMHLNWSWTTPGSYRVGHIKICSRNKVSNWGANFTLQNKFLAVLAGGRIRSWKSRALVTTVKLNWMNVLQVSCFLE